MQRAILTDSTMYQSARWAAESRTVHRLDAPGRWINHPVLIALRLLRDRPRHPVVMTTGNRSTLLYGLLCLVLLRRPKQVAVQVYLNEHTGLKRIHDPLMRLVLRRASGVIVNSHGEFEVLERRFGVPRARIRYVDYCTNVAQPELVGGEPTAVFSAGRNFRDYETLVEAVRGLSVDVVIVAGRDHLVDVDLPENVRLLREVPYAEYIAELRGAGVVVIPLSTETVVAGQVAMLEAMAYGKPIVTTRNIGTVDYVRHGIDGLLYEAGDVQDLRASILRIASDPDERERMAHAALDATLAKFTIERFVDSTIGALLSLAGQGATRHDQRTQPPQAPPG